MKKTAIREGTRKRQGKLAASHRGRRSQNRESIIRETYESDVPRGGPVSAREAGENPTAPKVGPEFKNSVEPPPPQLRRTRTTRDRNKGAHQKKAALQ
jgi:hypothetical protein